MIYDGEVLVAKVMVAPITPVCGRLAPKVLEPRAYAHSSNLELSSLLPSMRDAPLPNGGACVLCTVWRHAIRSFGVLAARIYHSPERAWQHPWNR